MSGTTRRRKHSPAVYRRRRLVVLLAVVAVAVGIWLLIAQPWRSSAEDAAPVNTPASEATEPTDAATDLPVPSSASAGSGTPVPEEPGPETPGSETPAAEASAAPTAAPPAAAPCRARDVTVEAVTDQESYASGQNPQLSIRLTNVSAEDCTLNVGTSTQSFTITSGNDTWWRSTDCQSEPSDMVVTLQAGQSVASATPITWDRTRSSVSTCDKPDRPRAAGGGASYHLSVEIGGFTSTQSRQFFLY